jgi:hypothetical protein
MSHRGDKKENGSTKKLQPAKPPIPDQPQRPRRQPDYQRPRTESGDLDEDDADAEKQPARPR